MKFDLTVIIPTFQMPEHTVAALESVIAQAGAGLAITVIVVDDASSEPFVSTVAPTTHCEVRVIRHKRNRGAAAARVTGIKASTTQWIAFLDADDTFLPHTLLPRLEFAVAEQRKRPDTPLFVCGGWVEREEDSLRVRIPNPAQSLAALCSGCWYCPGSTLIVQRRWLTGQPGYPDAGLRRLEDFDWGIRLGRAGGEVAVWDGAAARIQPSNITDADAIDQAAGQILQKHSDLAKEDPPAWHNMKAYLALERAAIARRDGHYAQVVRHAVISQWHRPRLRVHLSPGWTYRPFKVDGLQSPGSA